MKLLSVSASTDWGGAEIRLLAEAAGLAGRGHAVTLACPAGAPVAARAAAARLACIELPRGFALARDSLAGRLRTLRAVRRLLVADSFDLVATHGAIDSWLVALASCTIPKAPPMVHTHHPSASAPRGPVNRWLYTRAAARVITGGEAIRRSLVDAHGFDERRIVSIPTGIDLEHYRPGDRAAARRLLDLPDDDWPVLGIVASLRRAKGHHLLIDALARLSMPVRLLVIGDGAQRAALEKQADAVLPPDRARFVGRQADVLPWLQALDLFVLPTLHEGVPQSLSQAMAVGLCCVTTPVGGIPEIATDGDSALFVQPGNVDALHAGLERALADPSLRERLGRRAREAAVERCSIDVMLDRLERLYADLASRIAP
jgi:glycosyltransferase involved in cell wall biosynthesis